MFLSKFRRSFTAALTSVAISAVIFSCTPAPALANPSDDFCSTATEYNLNWHAMMQRGTSAEQIVKWHLEILKDKPNQLPEVLMNVVNKMLYLTVINKETEPEVTKEGLSAFCNNEINKLKQSMKSSNSRAKL